jgi:hypothetical protein
LVAAWVLFSVLPSTPELASMNDPSFFTAEPRINVNSLAPSTSSQSNEEIVVSWMRN